eukprot:3660547-Pyramimonas_sp.AAC.1
MMGQPRTTQRTQAHHIAYATYAAHTVLTSQVSRIRTTQHAITTTGRSSHAHNRQTAIRRTLCIQLFPKQLAERGAVARETNSGRGSADQRHPHANLVVLAVSLDILATLVSELAGIGRFA